MTEFRRVSSAGIRKKEDYKKNKNNRKIAKFSRSSGGFATRISVEKDEKSSEPREILKPISHFNSFDKLEKDIPQKKFLAKRTSNKKDIFLVVCANCGEHCEVPFKPSNNRPIFCSKCFVKSDKPPKSLKPEIKEIKEKLDRIFELLDVDED